MALEDKQARPAFTIAVPAWNAQTTLARAIESVLAQTVGDFELVVVDDGSTDDTLSIAQGYAAQDARITVLTKPNAGTASALNLAFSQAHGELFVVLDADDEFVPHFLQTALADVEQYPDYDIYGHNLWFVLPDTEWPFFNWNEQRSLTIEEMLGGEVIPGAGTVYRPRVFEEVGGYRSELRRVEDEDFWMRALLAGFKHLYLPEVLYRYIQDAPNRKGSAVEDEQYARIRVLDDLIASGKLSAEQEEIARGGIAHCEAFIRRLNTKFSVIVPAYNAQDTLAETLDAVLAQEYSQWECVVVDDGSSDGTLELARSYESRDDRFRVITQENKGTGGAYNTGVAAAVGEWVTICSADDVLLPELLSSMADAIERNPEHDIFSCNGYLCWCDGNRAVRYMEDAFQVEHSESLADVLTGCFFSVGACYRRSIWVELGGYREGIYGEDYDLWIRAMVAGHKHRYIPDRLSLYRVSPTQKSASFVETWRSDITIINDALKAPHLTREERKAGKNAILRRKSYIAEHLHPKSLVTKWRVRTRP